MDNAENEVRRDDVDEFFMGGCKMHLAFQAVSKSRDAVGIQEGPLQCDAPVLRSAIAKDPTP